MSRNLNNLIKEIKIKENNVSSFSDVISFHKMQKSFLESISPDGNYQIINFCAKNSESTIVGWISGWKNYDYSYIESIWVEPNYRKHGLAKKLVNEYIQKSRDLKCSTIITSTHNYSQSIPFWKKCGFSDFGGFQTPLTTVTYLISKI